MYKVIFDTNSIRNDKSINAFLGGRGELQRFAKVAEIIIPDMVIEEIKNQKRKHLVAKKDAFLSNPFHLLVGLEEENTVSFDVDNHIIELKNNEILPFNEISLTKGNTLQEIKKMALDNSPPFNENTDKGFKDAYIYFTVLEYLENCKDKEVFFVTEDGRLKSAFENNPRVRVIDGFKEFENYIDLYFKEDYFVEKLQQEIDEQIVVDDIEDAWLNIEENWILKIACNDRIYFVEVDFLSKEILDSTNLNFSNNISYLVNSMSFQNTHNAIEELADFIKYLSDDEIKKIFSAAIDNPQIHRIATDDDVKEFFTGIYDAKPDLIQDNEKEEFQRYFFD